MIDFVVFKLPLPRKIFLMNLMTRSRSSIHLVFVPHIVNSVQWKLKECVGRHGNLYINFVFIFSY